MKFIVPENSTLEQVMSQALSKSRFEGQDLTFNLCGINMVVKPTDTKDDAAKRFFNQWVPLARRVRGIAAVLDHGVVQKHTMVLDVRRALAELEEINRGFGEE